MICKALPVLSHVKAFRVISNFPILKHTEIQTVFDINNSLLGVFITVSWVMDCRVASRLVAVPLWIVYLAREKCSLEASLACRPHIERTTTWNLWLWDTRNSFVLGGIKVCKLLSIPDRVTCLDFSGYSYCNALNIRFLHWRL